MSCPSRSPREPTTTARESQLAGPSTLPHAQPPGRPSLLLVVVIVCDDQLELVDRQTCPSRGVERRGQRPESPNRVASRQHLYPIPNRPDERPSGSPGVIDELLLGRGMLAEHDIQLEPHPGAVRDTLVPTKPDRTQCQLRSRHPDEGLKDREEELT